MLQLCARSLTGFGRSESERERQRDRGRDGRKLWVGACARNRAEASIDLGGGSTAIVSTLEYWLPHLDASPTSRQRHARHIALHTTLSMRLLVPSSPASSWTVYKARVKAAFESVDRRVVAAFWLFGGFAGKIP